MLVVYQWFMYTVLALEAVPQAVIPLLVGGSSLLGSFLVWWSQLSSVGALPSHEYTPEYISELASFVGW